VPTLIERTFAVNDKTPCAIDNSRLIDCCAVNFTKDDIGFTYALFTVYIGLINTNNQIIQAIADAGKSYVVFGKIDSTAINLSAIASGTGGFVINGENENDLSGRSVSSCQFYQR
jgi:hypothetical protein